MEELSKSEKKRRAKGVENLATELVNLSATEITKLDCDDFLKKDIKDAQILKTGARKRQIKYITKQLRDLNIEPLLNFLQEKKGSKLKQNQSFHKLERWRDDIISEAIQEYRAAQHVEQPFDENWHSTTLEMITSELKNLDQKAIKIAALKYVKNRKPTFIREIFRVLKAAHEGQKFLTEE